MLGDGNQGDERALNANPTARTARKTTKRTQKMRDDKLIVPRIAGPLTGESVGVGQWKALDFPASGRDRSPFVQTRSYCEQQNQMIAVPEETFSRIADFLERIAEFVERLGPKEEIKEEPIERMLTPEKASKKMFLHPQTVTEWCREGKITATKLGRKWLIPREEVERHLHAYEVKNGKKKGGAK